ncbi:MULTISPECIES: hypothetical protein, partial [unclassified Endozoicomonas]|uniref:hypothetical protein n=1 Tax=unclassified Endozoicomonas TaxID=2644528 RepID=UPI002147C512
MRYFRPNALSLAVAITISSSVIGTQALADRRLQIKSVDIQGNRHTEFTQSEVIVKPTLGDDQQPIPKTFTTTYPDQTEVRAGYDIPSEGFTDILSGIEGGVASIDQFATDENDVAQKYSKILKVGNEGVFRFTHNLAEEKLLIEVRESMTHQDSIRTVRAQLGGTWRLEPFTGIASTDHLVGVLKGANKRAGKLGEADHYVALAILEVDKVEVNRRTFMRLIAAADQPPELQRLGQSLFVNDEVLLAAATSAYTQVHVLGKDLQQGILDDLLSYHKPVGYVVHVEDETQAYPVPAGYPKLEVTETPGEIIVFRGQKQNPTDVAFVEGLYYIWDKFGCNAPTPYTTARVKKDKVKSYKYVIRSRQMAMLEEFSAQQNAGLDSGEQYDDKVATLAYYEHLQQALTSAASVGADEFKFTIPHVGFTSFYFMPTWMHIQFVKHFGFKPALRNFLTSWHFVQDIHEVIPSFNNIYNKYFYDDPASDSFDKGGNFVSKVIGDFAGQLIEMENELAEKQAGHIGQKIHEIKQPVAATSIASTSFAATGQPGEEALEEEQAAIESKQDMASDDENDPYTRKQSLQQQLRQLKAELADREQVIENSLADIESQLGLTPDHEKSPEVRFQAIKQQNKKQIATIVLQQQHLQHHLQNHIQQHFQHHLEQQGSRTNLEKEDEIRARYATIAAHLNIQDLDSNAGVDAQEEHLLQKLKTMDAQNKRLLQRVKRLNNRKDLEDSYTRARKDALAAVLGIDPGKDSKLKDRDTLERTVYFKLFKLARLQKELDDIKTPGHPKAMPEVLETLSNVEKALERDPPGKEFDVYLRRKHISEDMQRFIREARQRADEEALDILDAVERILNLEVNKEDDKTARLSRIHRILDADNLSDDILNDIDITLWTHNGKALDEKDLKLKRLLAHLHYKVEDQGPNKQATEQQTRLLDDVEAILTLAMNEAQSRAARLALFDEIIKVDNLSDGTLDLIDQTVWKQDSANLDDRALKLKKLGVSLTYKVEDSYLDALSDARQNKMLEAIEIEVDIYLRRCLAAEQRGMAFTAKLASDLDVAFEEDANLIEQKDALIAKIWVLIDEVNQVYEDESVKRARNNEMAYQLNIKDYKEDATIDDQNRLIEAKLLQLDKEVFKADQPTVDERIAAIEDELDKQMARLEPKPRYALDREVAMTRRTIKEAESELEAANHNLDAILREQVVFSGRTDAHPAALDEDEKALNQAIKKIQTRLAPPADDEQTSDTNQGRSTALRNKRLQPGGDHADADKIWQLLQEQASLEAQIEGRKADIGRMKKVLKAAEEAVENDGTPSQYTPIQAKILDDLHTFAQQHPLKQLALQAANGLAELALENGKEIPYFPTIDFDDEFAPIGLRAMVGDKLTFEQASWIVEVFKNLKTTFPEPPFEPAEDHPPLSVPYTVLRLTYAARHGIERGAQEYDDRIRSMGSAGIHYIEHLPGVLAGVLKSFPEYFATRSASGNKVIALLREGRISKTELENYMKAIRGVDGYQTVA